MKTWSRKEYTLTDILTLESTGFDHWMDYGSVRVVSGSVPREDALQKDCSSLWGGLPPRCQGKWIIPLNLDDVDIAILLEVWSRMDS